MLNNGWINPNHTNVPGSDNNISFGGMCLPKDTNALNAFMNIHNTPHNVINAVITEQSIMRDTMLQQDWYMMPYDIWITMYLHNNKIDFNIN